MTLIAIMIKNNNKYKNNDNYNNINYDDNYDSTVNGDNSNNNNIEIEKCENTDRRYSWQGGVRAVQMPPPVPPGLGTGLPVLPGVRDCIHLWWSYQSNSYFPCPFFFLFTKNRRGCVFVPTIGNGDR